MVKSRLYWGERPDLFFWRDSNGNEVDVIAEQGTRLMPVEIKSGKTVTREAFDGLKKWRALAKDVTLEPVLIYGGSESYRQGEVRVTRWRDAGKVLFA